MKFLWLDLLFDICNFLMQWHTVLYFWVDRNIIDAFSDGMSLLELGNVGPVALQSYEEDIENALREVSFFFFWGGVGWGGYICYCWNLGKPFWVETEERVIQTNSVEA